MQSQAALVSWTLTVCHREEKLRVQMILDGSCKASNSGCSKRPCPGGHLGPLLLVRSCQEGKSYSSGF